LRVVIKNSRTMAVIEIAGESRVRPTASGRTCFAIMLEEDNRSPSYSEGAELLRGE
jgi:hypothetical protein